MKVNDQGDLFPELAAGPPVIQPVPVAPELAAVAAALPESVRLGTASWSFPGWAGLVYDRSATPSALAGGGLWAYARHPLLRAVGVDRGYYGPLSPDLLREFASVVPDEFRFLVKAPRNLTFPTDPAGGGRAPNPAFLHPGLAETWAVGPLREELGAKLGCIVFQFPPLDLRVVGGAERLIDRLGSFLQALPARVPCAVEIRNQELVCEAYDQVLRASGALPCYTIHPRMPELSSQLATIPYRPSSLFVIRWMLQRGLEYEEARRRFTPFDRIVLEDVATRGVIADTCLQAQESGGEAMVIINNKAEGSAPLSVFRLAEGIVGRRGEGRE
jgi:uncharacterized protein YecE (DUF72 family)